MIGKRIVRGLFFAALLALLAWAFVTGSLKKYFSSSEKLFGIESPQSDSQLSDDVLFDDDSTLDWTDPATDAFDPDRDPTPSETEKKDSSYEFALTPDYFNALLEKYAEKSPLKNVTSSFSDGTVILSGDAEVDTLADLLGIPAALVVFLPKTVPCALQCVPRVENGGLRVDVVKVSTGSDVLAPFLSREEVLSSVEDFLNKTLTEHLPSNYIMESAKATSTGLYVRFSVIEID